MRHPYRYDHIQIVIPLGYSCSMNGAPCLRAAAADVPALMLLGRHRTSEFDSCQRKIEPCDFRSEAFAQLVLVFFTSRDGTVAFRGNFFGGENHQTSTTKAPLSIFGTRLRGRFPPIARRGIGKDMHQEQWRRPRVASLEADCAHAADRIGGT